MTAATDPAPRASPSQSRATWRSVAVPSEHGGWSLTAEPVVLGLVVAWSIAGLALGVAAVVAFLARTPLKVVLVDRWRRRRLERTRVATRVLLVEGLVLVVAAAVAVAAADGRFWIPLALAAPLVLVELWFDMRSRSRRLVPELAGTIGIGSVVAAIVLAAGDAPALAAGLWCVVAARAVAAVVFVRSQLARGHGRAVAVGPVVAAQVVAVASVVVAWWLGAVPFAAVVALVVVALVHGASMLAAPRPAVVIGVQQVLVGVFVVAVTAAGVLAT